MTTATRSEKDRVVIFDTTLRDGEQSPRATMTLWEKMRVARSHEALGVDIIEAGFPAASDGDFNAVRRIAMAVHKPIICGLTTAKPEHIERCGEAITPAAKRGRGRIHTFISTSPVHMKHKLQMEPETVYELVIASVKQSRKYTDNVEWSAEDATRTEFDFLCRCVEAAIKAGATIINLPDTVGYMVQGEYGDMFRKVREAVPNSDKAIFSAHCHDDLGRAVSNSLDAVVNGGARQIECTINGIGERAGNAALEEIAAAMQTRRDMYEPLWCNIDCTKLAAASKLVSRVTGLIVQRNKAIVGRNAFAHEAGIHQDGMLKHTQTYEIMTPASVGAPKTSLVMGKHSGRHAFIHTLAEFGCHLEGEELDRKFKQFKDLADKQKHIYDNDLEDLLADKIGKAKNRVSFVSLKVTAGTTNTDNATIVVAVNGKRKRATIRSNDGPSDAALKAFKSAVPHRATLVDYHVEKLSGGTSAKAEATVDLARNGKNVTGTASDRDTVVASVRAYIAALNRLRSRVRAEDSGRLVGI